MAARLSQRRLESTLCGMGQSECMCRFSRSNKRCEGNFHEVDSHSQRGFKAVGIQHFGLSGEPHWCVRGILQSLCAPVKTTTLAARNAVRLARARQVRKRKVFRGLPPFLIVPFQRSCGRRTTLIRATNCSERGLSGARSVSSVVMFMYGEFQYHGAHHDSRENHLDELSGLPGFQRTAGDRIGE